MSAYAVKINDGPWTPTNEAGSMQLITGSTMKAFLYNNFGHTNTDKMLELPKPTPQADELLIKAEAYSMVADSPNSLGVAGIVTSTGNQAGSFNKGDKVFGVIESDVCAEFAVIKAECAALMPVNALFEHAAALSLPLAIAHHLLSDIGRLRWGQRLLIRNAAGGTAQVVLQVAKSVGAHVTVTTQPNHKLMLAALGADIVLDEYNNGNYGLEAIADMVIDFNRIGCLQEVFFPKLHVRLSPEQVTNITIDCNKKLQFGKMLVEDGSVKAQIARQLTWRKIAAARELLAKKEQTGQLVLSVD